MYALLKPDQNIFFNRLLILKQQANWIEPSGSVNLFMILILIETSFSSLTSKRAKSLAPQSLLKPKIAVSAIERMK